MSRTANPYRLPARVEVTGIDDAVSSLRDLAGRRDALRQMAIQASREADAVDQELQAKIEEFHRQLRMQQAELLPS